MNIQRLFRVAISCYLGLACFSAKAEFYTGNELKQKLESADSKAVALGYVGGVFDAYIQVRFCSPPSGITLGQVSDIVLKYLRDNPVTNNQTGDVLVSRALKQAWPCPQTQQAPQAAQAPRPTPKPKPKPRDTSPF